jgi:DeoR/GlpR family transcriptional regulator of sugar metabolism
MGLSRIGTLITDDGASPEDLAMLEDAGVRVIVARVRPEGDAA